MLAIRGILLSFVARKEFKTAFNEEVRSSERLIPSSYVNEHCLISI